MISSTQRFSVIVVLAVMGVATGCQQNTATASNDRGTYTAARHRQLGSNIPQPDSADTVNTRFDPNIGNPTPTQVAHQGGGL